MRALLIEDDPHTAAFVCKAMREEGHVPDHVDNGRDGLFLATTERYDVLVIDRKVPVLDGLSLLRALRAAGNATPAILLTALSDARRDFRNVTVSQILAVRKYGYLDPETVDNVRHTAYFYSGATRPGGKDGWVDFIPATRYLSQTDSRDGGSS